MRALLVTVGLLTLVIPAPALADLRSACVSPVAFTAPAPAAGWRRTSTRLLTVTQGPPVHRGQDVITRAGAPQVLIGKFAYGPADKDLQGEDVEVFVQRHGPCGPWESLGIAVTSRDGEHGDRFDVPDDGGRVYFVVPPDRALPVGHYPIRMLVRGDLSYAALTLTVVAPGTAAIVADIDGTLTTRDAELFEQLWAELRAGRHVPAMWPGAPEVLWAWARKGHQIVYLTGRPDLLRPLTLEWLARKGFPPGAVITTDRNRDVLPTSAGVVSFKRARLDRLREAGLDIRAAYGNATTDIQAYAAAGLDKAITFIVGEHAGREGTVAVSSYAAHLPKVHAAPKARVVAPIRAGW